MARLWRWIVACMFTESSQHPHGWQTIQTGTIWPAKMQTPAIAFHRNLLEQGYSSVSRTLAQHVLGPGLHPINPVWPSEHPDGGGGRKMD